MSNLMAQLQQDNARLTARCVDLEAELTELRQAYDQVRQSESRYRQVVENAPISISFLGADGQHLEANAAFENQFGFTAQDSQRLGFNLFTDPVLAENGTRPYMLRALAGETVIEPPTNFYDPSWLYGEAAAEKCIPGQGYYFPIWNDAGEVQEIVEISTVVTDLLEAQAEGLTERDRAAQERAQLFSTVAQAANLLLRSQDYITVLPEVVRLLGEAVGSDRAVVTRNSTNRSGQTVVTLQETWSREAMLTTGLSDSDWDSTLLIEGAWQAFHQQFVRGDVANFIIQDLDEPMRSFLGRHQATSMLLVPIRLGEKLWGQIGFDNCAEPRLFDEAEIAILQVAAESIAAAIERQAQDEELREAERRYRTLFELSNEGIYRFEFEPQIDVSNSTEENVELLYRNFRYAEVNDAFVQQYGFENAEQVIGKGTVDFWATDSEPGNQSHRDIIENGYRLRNAASEEIDAHGQRRHFLWNVVCDVEGGWVTGGWGTQTDITELKQAQQLLLEAEQARAQELERYNAELQQTLKQLQSRDRVLNATTESVAAILTDNPFDRSINNALAIIGTSVDCDRVEVFQQIEDDTAQSLGVLRLLFEWHSRHANPQQAHPILTEIPQTGLEALWSQLRAGECLTGPIESYPEPFRSGQIELGVQSTHSVPIFVAGQYWGIVAIDHCREQRQLTPMELSVFKIAATCIGSAIERDRAAQERINLLSAVAQVANLLLRSQDFTTVLPNVVRLLGEAVGSDRCAITQELPTSADQLHRVRLLTEWHCEEIASVLAGSPEFGSGVEIDIPPSFHQSLLRGDAINLIVSKVEEPDWRAFFEAHDNVSMLIVPIMLADGCWGHIGFDNCQDASLFDEAEIAILQVAAESVAAAIERQRKDHALYDSEKRFRTLFELSNEGIYYAEVDPPCPTHLSAERQCEWLSQNVRVVNTNPAFVAMYGAETAEELVGLTNSDVHIQDSEKNAAFIRGIVESGYRFQGLETEEVDRQGEARYFLNNATGITEKGHVLGFWATQTDVTELRQTQQSLLQAEQARAQELERFNAELQQALERLQARDRILEATATSANALLTTENLDEAVNTALAIIGENLATDRLNIIEIEPFNEQSDLSSVGWQILNEWHSPDTVSQSIHPQHQQGDHRGIEAWLPHFASGQSLSCLLEEMPEPFRSGQAEIGVKAYHTVPIFVAGHYWGNLGLDDCREAKRRDPAELAVLKTAAACIGSAIQRDRTQKALLQAEQARSQELQRLNAELQTSLSDIQNRDFIAETAATVANVLLREESLQSAIDRALRILGKALDLDRVAVIEVSSPSLELSFCTWQVLYEWVSPNTISQVNHAQLAAGTFEGIEALYEKMSQGQVLSYLLEELPEPFRSGQAELGVKALHDVPIFVAGQFWGAIGFDNCREPKRLSQTELSMLKIAADCIGSVIQRDRTQKALLQAEQDRVAELAKTNQALKNSLDRLAADPDLDAFLGHVLTEISQQLNIQIASLYLYEATHQTLNLHHWVERGKIFAPQDFFQFGPLAEPISVENTAAWQHMLETRSPLVINQDNAAHFMFPETQAWQLQWVDQKNLQSGINILLVSGDTPLGILCLLSAERSDYSSEELELAQSISHQATLAIQLTKLAVEAQQSAILGERNRLAREIHDTLAQAFGGILMQLQAANYFVDSQPQKAWPHVQTAQKLAQEGLTEARHSVWTLYLESTEYEDLANAIAQFIAQKQSDSAVQIQLQIGGAPYALHPDLGLNLLRIAQEAIANALKHAQAQMLRVGLSYTPQSLQLIIHDDGCGFDPKSPTRGFGLIGMQQRASRIGATWQLVSQPGQGATITVSVANPMTS